MKKIQFPKYLFKKAQRFLHKILGKNHFYEYVTYLNSHRILVDGDELSVGDYLKQETSFSHKKAILF